MAARITPRRPSGGSQARADRTRAVVLDETVRCILEEGFAAPSVRHITERAGVTWGVVQYHFGDLGGLLMAVVDKGFAELIETLEQLPPATPGTTVAERTEFVVDAVWEAFSSPTSLAALQLLISTRSMRDAVANSHLTELGDSFATLGRRLGEGLAAPHAGAIGNLVWTTLRGLIVAQLISPQEWDSSRDRRTLVDVITTYIEANAAR